MICIKGLVIGLIVGVKGLINRDSTYRQAGVYDSAALRRVVGGRGGYGCGMAVGEISLIGLIGVIGLIGAMMVGAAGDKGEGRGLWGQGSVFADFMRC